MSLRCNLSPTAPCKHVPMYRIIWVFNQNTSKFVSLFNYVFLSFFLVFFLFLFASFRTIHRFILSAFANSAKNRTGFDNFAQSKSTYRFLFLLSFFPFLFFSFFLLFVRYEDQWLYFCVCLREIPRLISKQTQPRKAILYFYLFYDYYYYYYYNYYYNYFSRMFHGEYC